MYICGVCSVALVPPSQDGFLCVSSRNVRAGYIRSAIDSVGSFDYYRVSFCAGVEAAPTDG